jgi:hypothetical protein
MLTHFRKQLSEHIHYQSCHLDTLKVTVLQCQSHQIMGCCHENVNNIFFNRQHSYTQKYIRNSEKIKIYSIISCFSFIIFKLDCSSSTLLMKKITGPACKFLNGSGMVVRMSDLSFVTSVPRTLEQSILICDDYHLLGDDNHHSHRRGNLKSYIYWFVFTQEVYALHRDSLMVSK